MRFLFQWQHVDTPSRLSGPQGLRALIVQLDGLELPARAWECDVFPARLDRYDPSLLDMLCLTGEVSWARLSSGPTQVVGATPVALFLREHADAWHGESGFSRTETLTPPALKIRDHLAAHGASFAHELAAACDLSLDAFKAAIEELVAAGLATSDGFAGLRAVIGSSAARLDAAGRWAAVRSSSAIGDQAVAETCAWALLRRYGVVFRRLLARESISIPWRDLARVYRLLEARGDIRGGRFVSGMTGEQFALPEAVEVLREIRRSPANDRLIAISAADPLNFTGIVTPGDRIRTVAGNRIVYRNGVPIAAMEGDMLRSLTDVEPEVAAQAAALAAGRRVPVLKGYVGRIG
jgi:ATP-dependent Lhr-like helicase